METTVTVEAIVMIGSAIETVVTTAGATGTIGIDGHVLDPLRETTAGGSETGHATESRGGSYRIATGEGMHEGARERIAGRRERKLTRGDGIGRAAAPERRETGDQGAKVSLNHALSTWHSMEDANV